MKKILAFFVGLFWTAQSFAQDPGGVEMASLLRSSGKIYVVVAVICIVFLGLAAYLISIDKKLSKLEKGENE